MRASGAFAVRNPSVVNRLKALAVAREPRRVSRAGAPSGVPLHPAQRKGVSHEAETGTSLEASRTIFKHIHSAGYLMETSLPVLSRERATAVYRSIYFCPLRGGRTMASTSSRLMGSSSPVGAWPHPALVYEARGLVHHGHPDVCRASNPEPGWLPPGQRTVGAGAPAIHSVL
jgi:hypothetical protein